LPLLPLDVIVGYYLPSFFGWIFLVFVILLEGMILSKRLFAQALEKRCLAAALVSNLVTTVAGYLVFDEEKRGGHVFSWIPVDEYRGSILIFQTLFLFLACFLMSVLLEAVVNSLLLKEHKPWRQVARATLRANIITYVAAALVLALFHRYLE
jgi:hypothetical protein